SGNPIPVMMPGATETCTGDTVVTSGQYRNEGTASGVGPGVLPDTVEDTDPRVVVGRKITTLRIPVYTSEKLKSLNTREVQDVPGNAVCVSHCVDESARLEDL
ncbi:hypothetical protein, partial [Halioglobus sp. HI00S01]|uniref:hypothetical protein n=1 Tax=Halioglobus sp. HI00S01 TaxID=1822214 RepID=UPI0018D47145